MSLLRRIRVDRSNWNFEFVFLYFWHNILTGLLRVLAVLKRPILRLKCHFHAFFPCRESRSGRFRRWFDPPRIPRRVRQ